MKVKEKSEKVGLKLIIQKTKVMATGAIASWQIDVETRKQWQTLFWGSKISADGDCSHEIKRPLLFGRKAMTNLDSMLKSRNITNQGPSSQSYGFTSSHVWMWETIKKAECWRIDAFELWCWRRFLRVPWTAKRSNRSIIKEISPEYSLEGLMLELKLQYLSPDAKDWFLRKDPDAGKDWRWEEKGMMEVEMVGWHHWL